MVGDGGVLPSGMQLVFVGKPTCFHICRLDCVFMVRTLLFGAFLSCFSLSLALFA